MLFAVQGSDFAVAIIPSMAAEAKPVDSKGFHYGVPRSNNGESPTARRRCRSTDRSKMITLGLGEITLMG